MDPRAIGTGRLVGQYSGSSRVSRHLQTLSRESEKTGDLVDLEEEV